MALLEIGERVVGDPDFGLSVFPDEDFEREVDGAGGSGKHNGSAALGISENQEFGVAHGEPGFGGFAAVVNDSEDGDVLGVEDGFQFGDGVVDRVAAGDADEAVGECSVG